MSIEREHRYLYTPYEKSLLNDLYTVKDELHLIAPYIKASVIKAIISNLPRDKRLKIRVVTRVTKQVFLQKSSDFEILPLLLEYCSQFHDVFVYAVNNLHAKIYIVDSKIMYITSSNLSYSGLNANLEIATRVTRLDQIHDVKSGYIHLMTEKYAFGKNQIEPFAATLGYQHLPFSEEETIGEENKINPLEERVPEEVKEESDLVQKIKVDEALQEINEFLASRSNKDYSKVGNTELLSPHIPSRDPGMTALELESFTRKWNEISKSDLALMERHLAQKFSGILSSDQIAQFKNIFVERSWRGIFEPDKLADRSNELYERLGQAFFVFIVTEKECSGRFFSEEEVGDLNNSVVYTKVHFDYSSALGKSGLKFVLHQATLPSHIDATLFYRICGFLCATIGPERTKKIFNNYLDESELQIYDELSFWDYKTLIQEIAQSRYGTAPNYKLISETGLDHSKEFTVEINIKDVPIAKGKGTRKSLAEQNAAMKAVEKVSKKHNLEDFFQAKKRKYIRLSKYELDSNRLPVLKGVASRFSVKLENMRLLDLALTQRSFVDINSSTRSNRILAYLGAASERFALFFNKVLSIKHGKLDDATLNEIMAVIGVPAQRAIVHKFDENGLASVIRVGDSIPISDAMKVDALQALEATAYLCHGFEGLLTLNKELWSDAEKKVGLKAVGNYVSQLQELVQKQRSSSTQPIEYKTKLLETLQPGNKTRATVICFIDGQEVGKGVAGSVKEARQLAAREVLKSKYGLEF